MQITIYGANGKVGSILTNLAIEKGYNVTAFVHGTTSFDDHERLNIVQGDIYYQKNVSDALKGSDAAISTLGSWRTPNKDVVSTWAKHVIPAMEQSKMKRIITLTGVDAESPDDKNGFIHKASRPFLKIIAPKILADGESHIALLRSSNLDWTTVRSPIMNGSGDPGRYTLSSRPPKPWQTINRDSVANAMLELIESDEWAKKAPYISRT